MEHRRKKSAALIRPNAKPVIRMIVNGKAYKTQYWSLTSFVIDGYDGSLRPGDEMMIDAVARETGRGIPVDIRARVVRHDSKKWRLEAVMANLAGHGLNVLKGIAEESREADVPLLQRRAG